MRTVGDIGRGRSPAGDLGTDRVLTICPTTVLAFALILALLFVAQLRSLSALAFLAFGLLLVVRRPQDVLDEIARYWWIFLIPGWALLSVLWSAYPGISLRYGIQLGLTFLIAVSVASRLSPRRFLLVLFLAYAFAALWGLGFGRVRGDGGGWLGIFGSKNAYSFAMSAFFLISLCLALAPGTGRAWRLCGFAGMALGFFLLVQGQSAGALLTTSAAAAVALTFVALRRFDGMQKLALATIAGFTGLFLVVFVSTNFDLLMDFLLETTGKDATLTGRTDLWREALREWAKSPLLGQGFQAVWVEGNPVAEAMWEMFGIGSKRGFHFHNTWLSNAVEIGLVGVVLQAGAFLTAVVLCFRWAIVSPRAESIFMAAFMLQQLALSGVEVVAFFQFSTGTIMILACLIYGLRARRAGQQAAQRTVI